MVRNLTLSFILSWFLGFGLIAQCVPDESISGLYAPDVSQGLPNGEVGVSYETVITMNVPTDTSYGTISATLDSMVLTGVSGLPNGFSYDCSNAQCSFPGGEFGCIRVFGISNDNADAKTWPIEASFTVYTSNPSLSLPYDLSDYTITLDSGQAGLGVKRINNEDYRFFIEPNPININSKLLFDLPESGRYVLDIYSLLGSNVAHIESVSSNGRVTQDLGEFSKEPGVYFVSLKQGTYSRSIRFIVQ